MIRKPYWVHPTSELPSHDFNLEIVHPGTNETFPKGAVAVRVDDDFWAVAALPYHFRKKDIRAIVAQFWPDVSEPEFGPNSET